MWPILEECSRYQVLKTFNKDNIFHIKLLSYWIKYLGFSIIVKCDTEYCFLEFIIFCLLDRNYTYAKHYA